ncbi:MAG TPA: efflux RND transporter permease subunit [Micromonosporaceae bacterium]|nr:efflux RND transporter permease subunit [Micromonosporaceae bacterium]
MSLLARFSLTHRSLVALISVVIAAFGMFAIPSLKQQLLPSLEYPAAFILAPYPGAGPEIIEREVAEPIEESVRGINGVTGISSTARENVATVLVEFEFGTDLTIAVNQLQTAVSRLSPRLPKDVEPAVFAGSTADLPAIVLAASSTGDETELAAKLDQSVVPQLRAISGVRSVQVTGAREQMVVITPHPAKLAAARVQPTAIGAALQANGVVIPAGAVTEAEKSLTVQVGAPLASLDDLRALPVTAAGAPVALGDVATVEQVLATPTSYTRTNGVPSLGIAVTATPDGNAVEISREITGMLAELSGASGTELTVIFDQAPFVERSIEALGTEGVLGLVMAVLVILVFLLSVRSTLVTAVSIPLSVLAALIVLWIGDHTLNVLTLGALTIAIGRVVDDSIVVLENIKRHLSYGEEKRAAILRGVREVAGAVTASTLTTVAVFAPIALVGGFVGQLFAPFAITVTVALLASLLVSLTIVPVLAYWFLKPVEGSEAERAAVRRAAEEKERRNPLQRAYLPVINFATRRRWATVALGLIVLLGTFGLASGLETNFIDQAGQNTLTLRQQLPVGSSLAATDKAARQVEEVLQGDRGVKSYQVTVGDGGGIAAFFGGGGANSASYSITLADGHDAEEMGDRLRKELGGLSGVGEISVGADGPSGFNSSQLQVIVKAADQQTLEAATEQVRKAFVNSPNIVDVTTSAAESVPRVEVTVKRAAAARVGLSEAAIGQTVAAAFRGSPLGQVTLDGRTQNVVLRFGAAPASLAEVRALPLNTPGGPITLGDVAEVRQVDGPVQITRIDGERSITVSGTATRSDVGAVTAALTERLAALDLPDGAVYEVGGVSADQAEAFADLWLAVLAAIAIVFVIMVATFRSLIQPLILLVSIPFAATGAVALLLATGTPLGVPALIGILMLVGIVVTNAIVLMDLINQYRDQGLGMREAVIEGGRHRLRPILMTALATIFALLPMAFGLTGQGGFVSQPLAIVVIGGLISSTLLTLVLVPALYTMVEGVKERWGQLGSGTGSLAVAAAGNGRTATGVPAPIAAGADRAHGGHGATKVPNGQSAREAAVGVEPPARPTPSAALLDGTDQFEVLRLPKSQRSPLPPPEQD